MTERLGGSLTSERDDLHCVLSFYERGKYGRKFSDV